MSLFIIFVSYKVVSGEKKDYMVLNCVLTPTQAASYKEALLLMLPGKVSCLDPNPPSHQNNYSC